MRIAQIRHGRSDSAGPTDRPIFSLEPNFVNDVLGVAVLVVVDGDGVKHFIVEVIVVGRIARILARVYVKNKGDASVGGGARQVSRIVAHEGVHIRVIGGRIHGDKSEERRVGKEGRYRGWAWY